MTLQIKLNVQKRFPDLKYDAFEKTSEATWQYNCIAWSVNNVGRWWWPDPMNQAFWPPNVRREVTIEAFIEAYELLGYNVADSAGLEDGYSKVAIYVKDDEPSHAARQLPNGKWTSKLGPNVDIEHDTLDGLHGDEYGVVSVIMKKPTD